MLYILNNRDNKPCFNTSCFKTQVLSSQRNSIVNPPPYAYCYTPFSPIIVSSIFLSLFIPSAFHVLRSALPSSPLCPATSHLLLCFTATRSHTFSGKLYFSNMAASAGRVIGLCSGFTVSCFALWFLGKGTSVRKIRTIWDIVKGLYGWNWPAVSYTMTFTYFYCKILLFDLKSCQDIGVKRAGPLEVVARKKSNLYDPGSAKPIPHML